MSLPLEKTIRGLSSRHLHIVLNELVEVSREGATQACAGDPAAREVLANLDQAQAQELLAQVVPTLRTDGVQLADGEVRALLLAFAAQPEMEPYLRRALDRRMLVSMPVNPAVVGALIVFLLSIKWKVSFKKGRDGKTEFEFAAGKSATPASLLGSLVSQVPGLGGGKDAAGPAS